MKNVKIELCQSIVFRYIENHFGPVLVWLELYVKDMRDTRYHIFR